MIHQTDSGGCTFGSQSDRFFLLFLLYPGSSVKIFNAFLCVSFSGEGEDGESFLRVDFSIDCNSTMYKGFMQPYAVAMLFIYPIGVPLYYGLTLFRNHEDLEVRLSFGLRVPTPNPLIRTQTRSEPKLEPRPKPEPKPRSTLT